MADGAIGRLRSMVCHSPHSLSNLQSHTLALFRLFAGAPAEWVMGEMDDDEQAAADRDLSGSGYIAYTNGVRGFMNSRADRSGQGWTLEFIGERGMIVSRNAHAQFELWGAHPETGEPIQRPFPNPWHPRSSMVDALEGVCRAIEEGEERICPGEFGARRWRLPLACASRTGRAMGGWICRWRIGRCGWARRNGSASL